MYLNDPKTSWWFDDCVSCMLFEGLEFQKYEYVFCIIRHRSTISPWRQDATLEWTSTKRRQWKSYYDDIMTRKWGCHPNNSHTPTRTTTSTTYSLVRVAIHQNDASLCWNWQQASGKSHVLSKRFAVRNQGEIPLKPTEKLKAEEIQKPRHDQNRCITSDSIIFNRFLGSEELKCNKKLTKIHQELRFSRALCAKICFRKSWSKKFKFMIPILTNHTMEVLSGCFRGFPASNLDSRSWWIFTKRFAGQPQTLLTDFFRISGESSRWYGENLQHSNDTMIDISSMDKSWQIMWRR